MLKAPISVALAMALLFPSAPLLRAGGEVLAAIYDTSHASCRGCSEQSKSGKTRKLGCHEAPPQAASANAHEHGAGTHAAAPDDASALGAAGDDAVAQDAVAEDATAQDATAQDATAQDATARGASADTVRSAAAKCGCHGLETAIAARLCGCSHSLSPSALSGDPTLAFLRPVLVTVATVYAGFEAPATDDGLARSGPDSPPPQALS